MMEQLKTVLLFCLVGLSLFLTYQLWYGQKPAELIAEDIYEQVEVEAPRSLTEAVVPYRIVLSDGNTSYLYNQGKPGFDGLWEELSDLLKNIENSFFGLDQNGPEAEGLRCLACYFDPVLPAGTEKLWLPGLSSGGIENLNLYCLDDAYWLAIKKTDQDEKQYLLLDEEEAASFLSLLEATDQDHKTAFSRLTADLIAEMVDIEREIELRSSIYVPLEEVMLEKPSLKPEQLDQELLLKTFFVDYNLARVIEERDGGLLYTDGEKGLRLSRYSFDYSYPRLEEGNTTDNYSEALSTSSSLISFHGGWPDNLRLESLSLKSRAGLLFYDAEWRMYINGFPCLTGQPTRAWFNDLGLFHFTRSLFKPEKAAEASEEEVTANFETVTVTAAPWTEALLQAIALLDDTATDIGPRLRLGALELAYAVMASEGQPQGIPVWFVIINGEEIILEADTLEVVLKEDLL